VAYSTSPQLPETTQIAETTSSVPIATVVSQSTAQVREK
jgi:hypothetical protein